MVIYKPAGRAREYSPLAANLYKGCDHKCIYCYVPRIFRISKDTFQEAVNPRKDVISQISKEANTWKGKKHQVLLSFTGDPYCHYEMNAGITRQALSILLSKEFPVAILTKGGSRILKDLDIFKAYKNQIKVGATLTFIYDSDSSQFEPHSARPSDRLYALECLHKLGIKTWASFEPVIMPEQSIALIKESLGFIDEYKIGKINQFQHLDEDIDWIDFLQQAVDILRSAGKRFYVKQDLREAAGEVQLKEEEARMDLLTIDPPSPQQAQGMLF